MRPPFATGNARRIAGGLRVLLHLPFAIARHSNPLATRSAIGAFILLPATLRYPLLRSDGELASAPRVYNGKTRKNERKGINNPSA
jgi:hypothetical protein